MSILKRILAQYHRVVGKSSPSTTAPTPTHRLPVALPVALPIAQHAALPIAQHAPPMAGGLPVAQGLPDVGSYGYFDPNAPGTAEAIRYTNPLFGGPINQWSRVQSTWLRAVRFDPYPNSDRGDLSIEFNDGFVGLWENTSTHDYFQVWHAPSKGKWLHRWSRKSDYRPVRGQQFWGSALKLRVQENG